MKTYNYTIKIDGVTHAGQKHVCDGCDEKDVRGIITDGLDISIEEEKKVRVYYAHHQWKYGTEIEKYELDIIRKAFPDAEIFNPNTDIYKCVLRTESMVMNACINAVRESSILVFTSMDGIIGKGVYDEIQAAEYNNIKVYYLHRNGLYSGYRLDKTFSGNDRLYATVTYDIVSGDPLPYPKDGDLTCRAYTNEKYR